MPVPEYSPAFVHWLRALKLSLRAARARDVLLERGSVTTRELAELGYRHAPRAIADLKDAGVTVHSGRVTVEGRRIARYTLVDTVSGAGAANRRLLPKQFRERLYREHGYRCAVCSGQFPSRQLQADHRVPFRIGGDPAPLRTAAFMPLCAPDNRAKSWSCESCTNWSRRDLAMCQGCFWADPLRYSHVAGVPERRVLLTFQGEQAEVYEQACSAARASGRPLAGWAVDRFERLLDDPA